ncbi:MULTISPECIES: hypothetical protein [unclassified Saccharicrinis]|uniref:hypothetical protein n=1 Tax=unclassified Saccharicrinis TaxID=2646859 RepID=UPI003D340F95
MKSEKRSILKGVVISGMIAGTMPVMANSGNLFNYEHMGNGSELRAELLGQYGSPVDLQNAGSGDYLVGEAKCGEGKCGEGKCGEENKKEAKKKSKTEKSEKTSEAKCGEKPKETKKESKEKTGESKCGENTCGGDE